MRQIHFVGHFKFLFNGVFFYFLGIFKKWCFAWTGESEGMPAHQQIPDGSQGVHCQQG